ncbi:phage tail sheath subtilisin-like domain-containing protein [Massilia sp. P8910]|uniref:phage tail sheath family protein n=1 Tax=Massilia antarctica TaxID=2765360 RepID=UPI001E37E0FE|nr:phage tail sheath C-terminal domain-containing protein [Massilia antarctica]MCE3603673.1 phage tail sheath subtilisin-like domain-containing protein [Massilia antarctica]
MILASPLHAPGVQVEWLDANPQHLDTGRTDVAGFLGMAERGPLHAAVKLESVRQFHTSFGAPIERACLAYAVEGFFANGGRTCWVVRVADPLTAQPARLRVILAGASFVLEALSAGAWGNEIQVETVWGPTGIVALNASEQARSQRIELASPDGPPAQQTAATERTLLGVPASSLPELSPDLLVKVVADDARATGGWHASAAARAALAGGSDGLDALHPHHFSGNPDPQAHAPWGIDALDRIDGVSLVAAPDLMLGGFTEAATRDAQIAILGRCIARRDRIALLDLPPVGLRAALAYRRRLPDETSFGALYYPWIRIDDPLRLGGKLRTIPPSGQVAGMFARCDRLRGVHKPPANELLEGVWDLSERIDASAHAELNDAGVNAIRALPGRGVLVLGARTLHRDLEWRYINVRRLFSMIEEALEEQMQWLTFEPNNPRLWKDVERAVGGFLERMYRAGMLDGASADDAYSVRCDASTNPPSGTGDGRVTCLIGIQPPYPAEFVIVRIGVTRSGIAGEQKGALDG